MNASMNDTHNLSKSSVLCVWTVPLTPVASLEARICVERLGRFVPSEDRECHRALLQTLLTDRAFSTSLNAGSTRKTSLTSTRSSLRYSLVNLQRRIIQTASVMKSSLSKQSLAVSRNVADKSLPEHSRGSADSPRALACIMPLPPSRTHHTSLLLPGL